MTEPRHVAISSQSAFPARAALRTFVQVLVALPTVLFGLAGVLALVAQDAFTEYLPDGWAAWLLGASLFVAGLAALLSRIMAYPAVDAALRRFGMSSTPKVPTPVTAEGVHVITNIVDVTTLPGYEVTEVSDAKTEVADILDQEHDGDNIATAETAVERLLAMGWRPTR